MPTYDYVCGACGHAFEHFQSMTSRRLRTCPACRERKLERLVGSGAGVIFKGSGFYETDYKRSGEAPPAADTAAGSSKADPKADPKAAAKAAPKSDAQAGDAKGAASDTAASGPKDTDGR